nr:unnamed protein product [Callosobruchus analis]
MERAHNLMIYNVPESNSTNLSDRVNYDKNCVIEVFQKLGVVQEESTIKHVLHLGRTSVHTRPIKVICNASTVKYALKSVSKLRGSTYKISGDKTKMEQDAYKDVLKTLMDRKATGEENLTIQYRAGVPRIVVNRQKNLPRTH